MEIGNMINPPHPGELLTSLLVESNISTQQAAEALEVTHVYLKKLMSAKIPVTLVMSKKLAKFFDTSYESWLTQQNLYDQWAKQNPQERAKKENTEE